MQIELKGITKSYGENRALQDCSVIFRESTFYAILGPNGSGKSTLLRIASLLEPPDRGEVIYRNEKGPLKKDLLLRRRIAIVLPGNTLFNDTVFNNVAYGLRIRGMDRKRVSEKVYNILKKFGLSDKADHNARALSSGQAQRVSIARALVTEPEFLFLDEPTASLDPPNTELIEKIIKETSLREGMTVVIITHNMFQAKRLADRVVFMYEGRIIEEESSEKFFTSPSEELTRRFISGNMVW